MQLDGTVAVVTGGASGIGRATALELARRGARAVAIADVHESRLADTATELESFGTTALPVRCDVSRDEDVEQLRDVVLDTFGGVDVVMNNAGVVILGPPDTLTMAEWDWILQINLYGVIRGVRAFVPQLRRQQRGWLVNTSSVAGLYAHAWDVIPYVTAKFGVAGLTEALALYLRPLGVGVSLLCPGRVDTNMADTARVGGTPDIGQWLQAMPLEEPVPPEVPGRLVCDAIEQDRFLILTHPDAVRPRMAERGNDPDGFVRHQIERLPTPPNLP